eukprot:gene41029-55454_t
MDRVGKIAGVGVLYAGIFSAVPIILIYLLDPFILRAFLPASSPSLPVAIHINSIVLWGFIPFGMAFIFTGIVRATGAVWPPLIAMVIALWGVRVPLANVLEPMLGADAIWISPFFKSPMADFGYDVSDYRDVDPLFGTLADRLGESTIGDLRLTRGTTIEYGGASVGVVAIDPRTVSAEEALKLADTAMYNVKRERRATAIPREAQALGSLKARITMGGIFALVLGIGLITTIIVGRTERDLLESQRQRELNESVRTAALLGHNVIQLQRVLESVAGALDESTMQDPAALKAFMQSKPVMRNFFANVYIATPDGKVRVMSDERGVSQPALNISDRPYFSRLLTEGRPMVSEPLLGSLTGEPIVAVTQPVRGAHGIYAVLGGTLRLSSRDLLDGLVDTQESDASALVVLTDAQ